jgi:hypothetical protein
MGGVVAVAFVGALAALLLVGGPFLFIWSLNTLFSLHITPELRTWLAALLLLVWFAPAKGGRQ